MLSPFGGSRRLRVGRGRRDRSGRVRLELGGAERAVVDAHLVDLPREPSASLRVAADPELTGRRADAAGYGGRAAERAVDVQPQRRSVVRRREV